MCRHPTGTSLPSSRSSLFQILVWIDDHRLRSQTEWNCWCLKFQALFSLDLSQTLKLLLISLGVDPQALKSIWAGSFYMYAHAIQLWSLLRCLKNMKYICLWTVAEWPIMYSDEGYVHFPLCLYIQKSFKILWLCLPVVWEGKIKDLAALTSFQMIDTITAFSVLDKPNCCVHAVGLWLLYIIWLCRSKSHWFQRNLCC